MAQGVTALSDLIIPQIFDNYVIKKTAELSNLVSSGAVARDPTLDGYLAGSGLTFNAPSYRDLDNEEENVSTDNPADLSTPSKISTFAEIAIRLNRNFSWSAMDLAGQMISKDPMDAITSLVAGYWARRMQAAFIALATGVMASNAAEPVAGDPHVKGDFTHDVSGTAYVDAVTNFTAANYIDTSLTMGENRDQLGIIMTHPIVVGRMQKNNLINTIVPSNNPYAQPVRVFEGAVVVENSAMPNSNGVFQSWLFGAGAFGLGMAAPKEPSEVERVASAGKGSGQSILHSRVQWCLHPRGFAYVGGVSAGGATNAQLADAASWKQVYPERRQIRMARLISREY